MYDPDSLDNNVTHNVNKSFQLLPYHRYYVCLVEETCHVENVIQDYDIFSKIFDEKIVSTWILNSLSYEAQDSSNK